MWCLRCWYIGGEIRDEFTPWIVEEWLRKHKLGAGIWRPEKVDLSHDDWNSVIGKEFRGTLEWKLTHDKEINYGGEA